MGIAMHRREEGNSSVVRLRRTAGWPRLTPRELLRHVEEKLAIGFRNLPQQAPEARQCPRILAGTAPYDVVGGTAPRKLRQHRRFLAIVEQLVERHLEGAR